MEGGGLLDGLEVEREVVFAGDEDLDFVSSGFSLYIYYAGTGFMRRRSWVTHKAMYKANLYKANQQGCDIRRISEYTKRHERILREPLLAINEQQRKQTPKHDQTDNLRRVPGESDASEIQAQEQHQGQAQDGKATEPVDRFCAFNHLRSWAVHV